MPRFLPRFASLAAKGFFDPNIRIRKAMRDYPELSLSTQEISGGIMLTFARINVEQSELSDSAGQVTGQVTPEIARMLGIFKSEMSHLREQEITNVPIPD